MQANNPNENGLKLSQIKSTAESVAALKVDGLDYGTLQNKIKDFIKVPSLCVVYLDYEVMIGRFSGTFSFYSNKTFKPKFIQKMRIFNENEELYFWRSEGTLKVRYRKDSEGNDCYVIDAEQVLFGTTGEYKEPGWTEISEERGTKLILPFDQVTVDDKENRVKIKTRNYVGFNEIHQATYVDCRFVAFTGINNKCLED